MVAALNWGLGHAVRCIPLIRKLQAADCRILLASDGIALQLLRRTFPELLSVSLPSYQIRYPYSNMYFNMVLQGPKILQTARAEYLITQKLIKQYAVSGIISDARFGCFSGHVPAIFITHQANLPIPDPFFYQLANFAQRRLLHQFSALWIPDYPPPFNLAGKLSSPPPIPESKYIGILSDMPSPNTGQKADIDLLAILSGPEPARQKFQDLIISQASGWDKKVVLVSGQPGYAPKKSLTSGNVETIPFLDRQTLHQYIGRSKILLSRSGYTTLMDLALSRKKAILVPTPGQSEQIYLAELHRERGHFFATAQQKFILSEAMNQTKQYYSGIPANYYPADGENLLSQAIETFLSQI